MGATIRGNTVIVSVATGKNVFVLAFPVTSFHFIFVACDYHDFVDSLKEAEPLKQCRYGIFDAEYDLKDGQKRTKLVFFLW